jgi:putative SOS response-associated peptidase YedK
MCFSALVQQNLDELSKRFGGEVDWEAFEELFKARAEGSDVKVSRALERNFSNAKDPIQERTRDYIERYVQAKASEWETEIFTQRRRLGNAEASLKTKETKKAREDVRIATKKVTTLLDRLSALRKTDPRDEDTRIFPMMHAPVLIREVHRTIIRPMRYACRLAGKPSNYDFKYPGTYNARRDNLSGFWNKVYGRNHAVMVISGFYENVAQHLYEQRELDLGEEQKNLVLQFTPRPATEMLVACVWDRWAEPGAPDLNSFAAITDEPPAEIAATGHQRCVIALQEQNIVEWLDPISLPKARLEEILSAKESPFYEHQIAA